MKPVEKWILAARPKTLLASVAPVVVGTALAYGDEAHHWTAAIIALTCSVLIQIGTNFANDYFDFKKGADTAEREGPLRVTQANLVSPGTMMWATVLVFGMACVGGVYLVSRAGWPAVWIGLLCILSGILYTGGPYPLGYLGLGDLFVFIFFGPVAVGGTYYVQALSFNTTVLMAGFGPGLFITAILTVNNLRDIEVDRKAGKRTLAVRFGKTFTRWEFALLIGMGIATPLIIYFSTGQHLSSLLALGVLALARPTFKEVFGQAEGPALNPVLADTARLSLLYSVLFSVGWLL